MPSRHVRLSALRLSLALELLAAGTPALASEATPLADEQCVMQCDEASDRCMAEAGADEKKQQACDDAYAECLERCK